MTPRPSAPPARPRLGLLVAPEPPPLFTALSAAMARWCVPQSADPRHEMADAWLASSPAAPQLERAVASGAPVAVWAGSDEEAARLESVGGAGAVLVTSDRRVAAGRTGTVLVGPHHVDTAAVPVVTPFVRARWRAAAGLPSELVVVIGGSAAELPEGLVPTALALAAVAVVLDHRLVDALARGTPCVTDATTAASVGAGHDREVILAEGDPEGEARRLATDLRCSARLGRAGRRLIERDHDLRSTVRHLAGRLGLAPSGPGNRVDWLLDELVTPATAPVRRRAADAMRTIVHDGP